MTVTPKPLNVAADFADFYLAYPRHVARQDALKAWTALAPSPALIRQIHAALAWQAEQESWRRDGGKYIPLPATWLRAERWTDEPFVPAVRERAPRNDRSTCTHEPRCVSNLWHEVMLDRDKEREQAS